jgi:hypothetical protein
VCTLHIQISPNGRYFVDFHVQIGVGRWYDIQLVIIELGQQHVKLHGPNKIWVNCNMEVMIYVTPRVSNPHDYVNHMFKRP